MEIRDGRVYDECTAFSTFRRKKSRTVLLTALFVLVISITVLMVVDDDKATDADPGDVLGNDLSINIISGPGGTFEYSFDRITWVPVSNNTITVPETNSGVMIRALPNEGQIFTWLPMSRWSMDGYTMSISSVSANVTLRGDFENGFEVSIPISSEGRFEYSYEGNIWERVASNRLIPVKETNSGVMIRALPNEGQIFTWSKSNGWNVDGYTMYTSSVSSDIDLIGSFENGFNVIVSANPGGTFEYSLNGQTWIPVASNKIVPVPEDNNGLTVRALPDTSHEFAWFSLDGCVIDANLISISSVTSNITLNGEFCMSTDILTILCIVIAVAILTGGALLLMRRSAERKDEV